ncbi:hypothetical protein PENDEC_c034G02229 [Penicillium decumbens]|uniref:Uncharacterized protein n=1 Tax=Penicillium decumbens TaxID=69771 RepID=A0A1V6NVG3_PENDC|nr:hypothetical protein PENDEC_c034G02229 [Penicillium decumbens]
MISQRPNNAEANNVEEPPKLPRNKRWKKISASVNADDAYKEQTRDPEFDAYSYDCLCRNLDDRGSDEDDESDDEDEETEENASKEGKIPCDGGEKCLCLKPAEEHPGHPWVITKAAHLQGRLGAVDGHVPVDDGEGVTTLERESLLKPDSEVKSLPMIMASFIRLVGALIGPDLGLESNGLDKKLFAYAKKHNIELKGLSDLEDFEKILIEKSKAGAEKVEFPAPNAGRDDPWGWKKALATYKNAERKRHAFDKKDPLDGEMMDGIKNNLVVSFA